MLLRPLPGLVVLKNHGSLRGEKGRKVERRAARLLQHQNQAMRFGDLPIWALRLAKRQDGAEGAVWIGDPSTSLTKPSFSIAGSILHSYFQLVSQCLLVPEKGQPPTTRGGRFRWEVSFGNST